MSAVVRVFAFSAVIRPRVEGSQLATDSFLMDKLPYLERWNLTATDSAAVSTGAMPADTEYVYVQVQPTKRVFVEVNSSANDTLADTSSPYIMDEARIKCGPGHTISFREYIIE